MGDLLYLSVHVLSSFMIPPSSTINDVPRSPLQGVLLSYEVREREKSFQHFESHVPSKIPFDRGWLGTLIFV